MSEPTYGLVWNIRDPEHVAIALPFGSIFGTTKEFGQAYLATLDQGVICESEVADSGDIQLVVHCERADMADYAGATLRAGIRYVALMTSHWDRRREADLH